VQLQPMLLLLLHRRRALARVVWDVQTVGDQVPGRLGDQKLVRNLASSRLACACGVSVRVAACWSCLLEWLLCGLGLST